MLEQLYIHKQPCPMVAISPKTCLLVSSQSENNGIALRNTEYREVSVEDSFKQFTIRDFEIANILSVGAVHLLKPVSFDNHDVDNFASQVDTISSGLDKAVDNSLNAQ